jgi:predicted acylesterase/phospholipase RssA
MPAMVLLVDAMIPAPAVGLALSGGGSRAIAFGLGCLRALHDQDVLRHVRVVSGISGGSLLAAMWTYGPAEFAEFDAMVTAFLRRGLQRDLVRAALTPSALARSAISSIRATPRMPGRRHRTGTRTDLLAQLLRTRLFGTRELPEVTLPNVTTVITATDLVSTNAVRFGNKISSCSPYGLITNRIPVADAIAASAAHPVLLPALRRTYEFQNSNGICQEHSLAMTDGGVYDNLGLSPLLPGRSSAHTRHVYPLNYIIAIDAGRGRARKRGLSFLPERLNRSMDITYARAQDGMRTQLNQATNSGHIHGFIHAYLAMRDDHLPTPLTDLIPRARVVNYPTNFASMEKTEIDTIATRGEQLTRILARHYCSQLYC